MIGIHVFMVIKSPKFFFLSKNLDEMYSDSIISAYGKTITNLSTTLEKLNIDFYEAVANIPNLL